MPLDNYITLSQLTKSVKGLVNKINSETTVINSKIGSLANLNTSAKTDLVAAINEVATNSGTTQVNADWNATSGVAEILNKPTIPTVTSTYNSSGTNAVNGVAVSSALSGYVPKITSGNNEIFQVNTETDSYYPGIKYSNSDSASKIEFVDYTMNINNAVDMGMDTYVQTIKLDPVSGGIILNSYKDEEPTTESANITIGPGDITIFTSGTQGVTVHNLNNPTSNYDAAHKKYVDDKVTSAVANITYPVTSVNGSTGAVTLNIPDAQVQSDWNATSGMGVILNKPTIPAATTVTQTLTTGTAIGSVNGTTLYAPTAYDDTALAARVTALEQIPWVTYYTGSSAPSNSQGNNGDLYFQTSQ